MGRDLFLLIISLSISSTIFGIVLFLLKKILKKHVTMKWQYYIWLILLLRLVLPFATELNVTGYLFDNTKKAAELPPIIDATEILKEKSDTQSVTGNIEPVRPKQPVENNIQQSDIYLKDMDVETENNSVTIYMPALFWIFGALIFFVVKLVDYLNFLRYIKASNQEITDEKILSIMDDVIMDQGIHKNIHIYQNKLVISPMMAGIFHPFVALPQNLGDFENLSLILTHELIHYKRQDILYKWLFQIIRCIHWFNPFLYFVNKDLNQSCELSCDEAVIKQLTLEKRTDYGNILLHVADLSITYKDNVLSTTLIESKKYLKARLDHIMKFKKPTIIGIAYSLLAIVFLFATAAIAGAKAAPKEESEIRQYSSIIEQINKFKENSTSSILQPSSDSTKWKQPYENNIQWDKGDFTSILSNYNWDKPDKRADSVYDSDSLIAGQDICNNQSYSYYMKDDMNPSIGKYSLIVGSGKINGSETLSVFNVNKDTTFQLESSLGSVRYGKFKLVLIDPDKKVSTIASGKHDLNKTITLKKGRNLIKMVAKDAKIKGFDICMYSVDKNALISWYSDEYKELATLIMDEMRKTGKVNLDELVKCVSYLESEDVSECIRILIKENIKISDKQLSALAPFADEEILGEYLTAITKNGGKISASQIIALAPFLDSEDLGEIMINILDSSTMTLSQFSNVIPFLDSDTAGKVLLSIAKRTKGLDYRQFSNFYPFMDSEDLGDFFKQYVMVSDNPMINEIKNAAPFMDSEDLMDCLLEAAKKDKLTMSMDVLISISPFLDSEDLAELLYKLINSKQNVSIDAIVDISAFLDSDDLAGILKKLIGNGSKVSVDDIVDVSHFLDSDDLADCLKKLIKKGTKVTIDQIIDMKYYLDEDDFVALIKSIK